MAGRDENGAEEERSARARGDRPGSVRRPRIARAGNSDGFPYTGAARGARARARRTRERAEKVRQREGRGRRKKSIRPAGPRGRDRSRQVPRIDRGIGGGSGDESGHRLEVRRNGARGCRGYVERDDRGRAG